MVIPIDYSVISGTFVGISRGRKRHFKSVHLFIDCQRSFACPILNYNGYVIELHYTLTA
jgi:hypothetical protein